jgi:hypothetical protein
MWLGFGLDVVGVLTEERIQRANNAFFGSPNLSRTRTKNTVTRTFIRDCGLCDSKESARTC